MENLMLFRNTSQNLIDAFVYCRATKSRKQSLGKYGFDKMTKLNTCDIKIKKGRYNIMFHLFNSCPRKRNVRIFTLLLQPI